MFNELPDEVLCHIASFLPLRGLIKFSNLNRRLNIILTEDEDGLDELWGSKARFIGEQFFWMFGSNSPLSISNTASSSSTTTTTLPIQVTPRQCKFIEKIEDVDDEDIMINNSPLKSSSVLKFRKQSMMHNWSGKMIKITPRALISKMAHLNGSSNDYGAAIINQDVIRKMADLITYGSITLSMWIKIEETCEGGVLFGVQNRQFSSGEAFVPVLYITTNQTLRATFWGANSISYADIPKSKWNHIALTKHNNEQHLYFNGKLVGSSSSFKFTHHQHQLYYGQLGSGLCDGWYQTNMNRMTNCYTLSGGKIADVCIVDKALGEEELKQLMVNSKCIPITCHWDFIQDNAVTIIGRKKVITIQSDFEEFLNSKY